VPPALRGLVEIARRIPAARYVRGYRRRQPLDASRLAYYEALACMRGLVRTAEARLAPIGESGLNPLDASSFGERLSALHASHRCHSEVAPGSGRSQRMTSTLDPGLNVAVQELFGSRDSVATEDLSEPLLDSRQPS